MKKIILSAICLMNVMIAFSQDIHFSQFNASPLNLNPALTGLFDGDYRFIFNHRNQWSSVTVPYSTYSVSADMVVPVEKWHIKNMPKGIWGAGLVINKDQAGDGQLGIIQAKLSLSYTGKISKDSSQFLSFAIQPGITNKSIDYTKLQFDEQYDGDIYNPSLPTGEIFQRTSFTYLDLALGMRYHYQIKQRRSVTFGFAYTHFNAPMETFANNYYSKLSPKFDIHANGQFIVDPKIDILPSILWEKQNTFNETILGVSGKYLFDQKDNTNFYLGLYMRMGDAIYPSIAMDYRDFNIGLSYDINTSDLTAASHSRGGFEISLVYIMRRFVPLLPAKRICPVYL